MLQFLGYILGCVLIYSVGMVVVDTAFFLLFI